jgi:predicted membrane protein (TIGR00267 family)
MGRIDNLRRKIKRYSEITQVDEIARRYFVMNAFDGCLTILGVIVGAYFSSLFDARIIIGVGFGSSIAMGMSGLFGAYMAEAAERKKKIQELEQCLLTNLDNSIIMRASRFSSIYVAVIDSLAPFISAQASLIPIYLSMLFALFPVKRAMEISMVLIIGILFLLGIFLGRISRDNLVVSGLKMVVAGLITFSIILLLGL